MSSQHDSYPGGPSFNLRAVDLQIADVSVSLKDSFSAYVDQVSSKSYPAPEHQYEMPAAEKEKFLKDDMRYEI